MKPFHFVVLLFAFCILASVYRNFTSSIFFKNKERINVVFYGQNSFFYSFDRISDSNYIIKMSSDFKVLVPGGYSFYRLGSLGKLASLEKKPDLFQKTYSAVTSSIVDLYFYPKVTNVFYDNKDKDNNFPSTSDILFNHSNSNWIDRIFLYFLFLDHNLSHYKMIDSSDYSDSQTLAKMIQGTLYKRIYRKIGDNIQIIYQKNYQTAVLISNIVDGEGIRVVDISQDEEKLDKCLLISKKEKLSGPIIEDLQSFFHCQIKAGETESSDIIFKLGNLEKDWSAN
jgi:hypothetical protein